MSHDDTITIHADILQITDAAVLIGCEGEETWLPLSQIDFYGGRGDTNVPISLPEWLGNDKGLFHGDGMRATVTNFRAVQEGQKNSAPAQPQASAPEPSNDPGEPEHRCETCMQWGGKEVGPDAGECEECSVSAAAENPTGDYWRADNTSRRCETCAHYGADYPDDCEPCQDDNSAPNWKPSHPAFAPILPGDSPAPRSGTAFIKEDTVTVFVPLNSEEREAVGDRMAGALEKIAELEDDLDAYRKSVNAEIKSLQKDAEKARKEWQEGKTEEEVYCDMMADYDAEAIIWVDHDTGKEMKRRPMTAEERQYRLPIPRPSDSAPVGASDYADDHPVTPVSMGNPKTCITCGSLAGREGDDLPETCQTCAQANNGAADNWHPIRECRTCVNSHTQVNMPPCAGCALNVEEAQRGESDAWEWKDEEAAGSAVNSDDAQELAQEDGEGAQEELSGESGDEDSTATAPEEPTPGEGDAEPEPGHTEGN